MYPEAGSDFEARQRVKVEHEPINTIGYRGLCRLCKKDLRLDGGECMGLHFGFRSIEDIKPNVS